MEDVQCMISINETYLGIKFFPLDHVLTSLWVPKRAQLGVYRVSPLSCYAAEASALSHYYPPLENESYTI
jgi:hypothetical protein